MAVQTDIDQRTEWSLYLHPPPRMDHSLHDSPPHLWPGTATGSKWEETNNNRMIKAAFFMLYMFNHNFYYYESRKYTACTVYYVHYICRELHVAN